MYQQQLDKAESYLLDSADIFTQINDIQRQGVAYSRLSHYYKISGQHQQAIKAINKALEIAKIQDNKRSIMYAYDSLTDIKIAQGQYDEAHTLNQLLGDLALQLNSVTYQLRSAQWSAMIAVEQNNIEQAGISADKMLSFAQKLGSQPYINGSYVIQLSVALKAEAFTEAQKLVNLLEQMDDNAFAQNTFTPLKAEYLAETSGSQAAIDYLSQRLETVKGQGDKSMLLKLKTLVAQHYLSINPQMTIQLLNDLSIDDNNVYPYHWVLAQAYHLTGRYDKAIVELNTAKLKYSQRWTIKMQKLLGNLSSDHNGT